MSIKIISDSACDIWNIEGVAFDTVPLTISTDERTFVDDENLDVNELLSYMKKYEGRSFTACPGVQDWLDKYEGADEIYVVCMTSGLSGTYNSALIAKDMFLETHPDVKIEVFDTLSAGGGEVLFIENLVSLINDGLCFEEICKEAPLFRKNSNVFFAFQSLHNFAQNGRISKVVAASVGVLGLSILGTASPEGTLSPIGKCRGEKKTIVSLYESLLEAGYCGGKLRICHISNPNLANHFTEFVYSHFPEADIKVYPARGLVSYYGEEGGIIIGYDTLDPISSSSAERLA